MEKAAAHLLAKLDNFLKIKKRSLYSALATFAFISFVNAVQSNAEPIDVISIPIEHFNLSGTQKINDRLEFVGGLELRSQNESFGGLSGIRIVEGGKRILAISDKAKWLKGDLNRSEDSSPKSITNLEMQCVCQVGGQPYKNKHRGDTEALEVSGSRAYIAFERTNRVNGYDINSYNIGEPAQVTPNFTNYGLGYRQGFEALALAPKASPIAGKFVVIAENSLNEFGNHRAFIADAKTIEEFSIEASGEYAITDATFLQNGNLLILERRVGISIGVGMRIREIAAKQIAKGKLIVGDTILEAGLTSQIDNMEGISAWKNHKGETIISLVSDDNYNRIQRTLYLEFKLSS